MDSIQNRSQKLIYNLIYFTFVFSLLYSYRLGIGLEINLSIQISMVFLGSMAIKFFLFNPLILYVISAIGFLCAILVNRYITPFILPFGERIFYLFENIFNNLQGKERITENNSLLFWAILIALVSLFTAIIIFKGKNIFLLLPLYFGSFLYYWYNFLDQAIWMISIFLLSFFVLIGLNKYSNERLNIEGYNFERLYAPWLQTVSKYSILIVVIALLLPKGYNYIQWPWLQQKVYNVFPFVEDLRSYNSFRRGTEEATLFNFSITGFQGESSKLGGPVILSDKKIMTVYSNNSNYLRGNVKQIYTGNEWKTLDESSNNYRLKEDFSELSDEEKDLYFQEINITITNYDFASTTLFSPYKPESVNFKDNSWVGVNRDESLIISQGVYDGESYYIQAQKPLPYGMLISLGINQKKEDIVDLDIYLQIPEDKITKRTESLVNNIVKDSKNDFEKAVAIEKHLRNNYKYNLNVEEVPENQEFIDYFLFDGLEGYCTYYATTMAIMLRLEGIPSRYVEGYLAKDSTEEGVYEVRHQNAHAWVEAFIEPVGWMTFEPTPAYALEPRLEDYQQSLTIEGDNPSEGNGNYINPRNGFDGPEIVSDQDIGAGGFDIEDQYNPSTDASKNFTLIVLGAFLLLIPIRFIVGLFRYLYQENKAKKLSNADRIIYLYKQILKLTKLLGFPQLYGETHYEYAKRVAYKFYEPNEKGLKEITDIFVKSKYSNAPTLYEDVLALEIYRRTLDKRLKNLLGRRTYYYRKYVKKQSIKGDSPL